MNINREKLEASLYEYMENKVDNPLEKDSTVKEVVDELMRIFDLCIEFFQLGDIVKINNLKTDHKEANFIYRIISMTSNSATLIAIGEEALRVYPYGRRVFLNSLKKVDL